MYWVIRERVVTEALGYKSTLGNRRLLSNKGVPGDSRRCNVTLWHFNNDISDLYKFSHEIMVYFSAIFDERAQQHSRHKGLIVFLNIRLLLYFKCVVSETLTRLQGNADSLVRMFAGRICEIPFVPG